LEVSNATEPKARKAFAELSSDFDIPDDWIKTFDDKAATAMDAVLAQYAGKTPRLLFTQQATYDLMAAKSEAIHGSPSSPLKHSSPQSSQEPILDQNTFPSPPPVIKETDGYPEGSPFQPVKFSDDTIAYIPIVRDEQGHANNKIYNHILRISSKCTTSDYEIQLSQQLSLRINVVNSLHRLAAVIIKRLDAPRDDFNLRFLIATYKIPAHTPVDVHGTHSTDFSRN